jgi:hypothetical protein
MVGTMSDDEHLTHGWEPETPATDSLLRTFLEGTAARGETLAAVAGGRATRRDGIAMSDPESPIFFDNAAVLLAPCEYLDKDAVVAALHDFYPDERGVLIFSAFPTWDLRDAGFTLMGHPPFMVRPPGGAGPATPDDLEIRRVDSEEEAAVFAQTIEAAYPMPGAAGSPLAKAYAAPGIALFNGYYGDRCVATGGAWTADGVNDVNWISAMPETRRRGVGAAITYAATVVDPDAPAVLIASDDGVGVYERLGYIRLLRLTLWMRPGQ